MRWVWPILAFAVLATIVLPIGTKSVYDYGCTGDWESGPHCTHTYWDIGYYLLRLDGTMRVSVTDEPSPGQPIAFNYFAADAPNSAQMFLAVPIVQVLILVGAIAVPITGMVFVLKPAAMTRRIALVAWSLFTASIAVLLVSIAWHSFTWRGEDVEPFIPGLGMIGLVLAPLSGLPLMPAKERDVMPALPRLGEA